MSSSAWRRLADGITLVIGIVAAATMLSAVKALLQHGLGPVGWATLFMSGGLFFFLLWRVVVQGDEEQAAYRRAVAASELGRAPGKFMTDAAERAQRFSETLNVGSSSGFAMEYLPAVTDMIQERGPSIRDDPEFVCDAAAYLGEFLRMHLGGKWERRAGDAVVRLGAGRARHYVSPGMMVLRVADEPRATLEAFVAHEHRELAS